MINSINFIDGLDGLSPGIALIAAVTLGLISLTDQVNQPFVAVLCFALAGAPARVPALELPPGLDLPGDRGVMFVGYTLAVLAILARPRSSVALLVLGVPIIDTFWVIVRRLVGGPLAVHARIGATSTTGCSTWACRTAQTVLLIYAVCVDARADVARSSRARRQLFAFVGCSSCSASSPSGSHGTAARAPS